MGLHEGYLKLAQMFWVPGKFSFPLGLLSKAISKIQPVSLKILSRYRKPI